MLTFNTPYDREAFATRLHDIWYAMLRSQDQGEDGRIGVSMEMIDDIRAAEFIVRTMDVRFGQSTTTEK